MDNQITGLYTKIGRKRLAIAGAGLGMLLLVACILIALIYSKRQQLLARTIKQMEVTMANTYQLRLAIDSAYFSGLSTITLQGSTLTPHNREQLISIKNMSVRVRLWPLLAGNVKFGQVNIYDTRVSFIKHDSISNYDFIFRKTQPGTAAAPKTPTATANLAQLADNMVNNVLYKIPADLELRNFSLTYRDDSTRQHIRIPAADIKQGNLTSAVFLNNNQAAWQVTGQLNPDKKQLYLKIYANGARVAVPLIDNKFGIKLSFDTIETRLHDVYWSNHGLLHFKGEWAVRNLTVNNWRISETDVVLPQAHMDAELIVGNNHIELAKETAVTVKNLTLHPYFRYTTGLHPTYSIALETPKINAQDLFDAFPSGLFTSLEGIRVGGQIQYHMDAFLDTANPDSVRFNSAMQQEHFRINTWGNADIPKINSTFTYTPYEEGKPVRDIIVGPQNPNFVPIGQISPNLRNAILTTEDPSFYSHNGFVEEAIRSSIATNYQAKAFKRGGSTISMQLVKNIYLNRNKTIVRKLEEILIVWLMESTRAVSKDRMYEVYLNMIEWGRNVYGIGEAARYYFNKRPSDLNIGESIYLASIIPHPKTGLYAFSYSGQLKPYASRYFNYIGNIMARRGLTPPDTTGNYGFYSVSLREALRPERPILADSLHLQPPPPDFDSEIEQIHGLLDRLFDTKNDNETQSP